ncbi:hypothetical protein GWN75_03440 [candidate division KSB1 bacterium]|nr:hypothetical protein [candidate division KSB1 bacterium]NIU23615.1 hypothetical protein [candidate division KSB1 bacterium]NIW17464.1 hypothetical protein [candidate division KSB1 bacterium]
MILEKVERIRRGEEQKSVQSDPSAILVDSHVQDEDSTFELGNFLQEKGVLPHLMFQQEQTPEQKLKYYERILHKVAKLIIFFGSVQADWVSERLITVQKLMAKNNYPPHICGIYLAPPPKRPGDINFIINFLQEYEAKPPTLKLKLIDNSEGFDPENLREILEYKPA